MPFNIPKFADLKTAVSTLRGRYEAAHQVKNSQRFFGRWSSSAPNTDRLDDIGFIERLTKNVEENKFYYQRLDKELRGRDYARDVTGFLREVIAGSLLLNLIKIDSTYAAHPYLYGPSKEGSALVATLLDMLGMSDLSDLPRDKGRECLAALKRYTQKIEIDMQHKIRWHSAKENNALHEDIDAAIRTLESAPSLAVS